MSPTCADGCVVSIFYDRHARCRLSSDFSSGVRVHFSLYNVSAVSYYWKAGIDTGYQNVATVRFIKGPAAQVVSRLGVQMKEQHGWAYGSLETSL